MYRISVIINEVYNKFLPLAEQRGIQLNLDMVDPNIVVDELTGIKEDIEKAVSDALGRSTADTITIQVSRHEITISDTGTTLSRPLCELLSNQYISVRSRVGFGTRVTINLKRVGTKLKTLQNRQEIAEKTETLDRQDSETKTL